jgi:hypothetical protein
LQFCSELAFFSIVAFTCYLQNVIMTLTCEWFPVLTSSACCFNAIWVVLWLWKWHLPTPTDLFCTEIFTEVVHQTVWGVLRPVWPFTQFKHNTSSTSIWCNRNAKEVVSSQIHSLMFDLGLNRLSRPTFVTTVQVKMYKCVWIRKPVQPKKCLINCLVHYRDQKFFVPWCLDCPHLFTWAHPLGGSVKSFDI